MFRPLAVLITTLLFGATTVSTAQTWGTDGTFTIAGLLSGQTMAEGDCVPQSNSIWVVVDGKGDCIRYFHAGVKPSGENQLVHFSLHDDRLRPRSGSRLGHGKPAGNDPVNYTDSSLEALQAEVNGSYSAFRVPSIRLSRPGTYGSSGDHRQRRRQREVDLTNAAIDALKKRYSIKWVAISGHSAGGHLAAALLRYRSDLACVVITAGLVSPAYRAWLEGWSTDDTGYEDYVDPLAQVGEVRAQLNRTIVMAGDPRQSEGRFAAAQRFFQQLHESGHRAVLLIANAPAPDYDDIGYLGFKLVRWCAQRKTVDQMIAGTKFLTAAVKPAAKVYNDQRKNSQSLRP